MRAFRMPKDQAAAGVLFDREEIEFDAEFAMIAPLSFLDAGQVRRKFVAVVPRRAVNALEHRLVLVPAPVRSGDGGQFERADTAGGFGVPAAAEIGEVADRVERDRFAFGYLPGHLDLVRVVLEGRNGFVATDPAAGHRIIRGDDLCHAVFEALQVLRRERRRPVEVVVETVLDGGADGRLGVGKEIRDRVGQDVRGRMAQFGQRRTVVPSARIGGHADGFGAPGGGGLRRTLTWG